MAIKRITSPDQVKVDLVLTEGYQRRYTEACLAIIKEREKKARAEREN